MRSLKYWLKVTRPDQSLIAGLATYAIALISNGHDWLSINKIAASVTMFLMVMGSSLFHYGAAHRMYARKYWDRIEGSRPWLLITLGSIVMLISLNVAYNYLPRVCFLIAMIDTIRLIIKIFINDI